MSDEVMRNGAENDPPSWQSDWVIELPEHPVVPLADVDKDEFIHHLFDFMRQEYDYGYSPQTYFYESDGQTVRIDEWRLNTADGRELPRLQVISESDALRLYVAGRTSDSDTDTDIWREGVSAALAGTGSRQMIYWGAIIAQALPNAPYHSQKLGTAVTAAGIEVFPSWAMGSRRT